MMKKTDATPSVFSFFRLPGWLRLVIALLGCGLLWVLVYYTLGSQA